MRAELLALARKSPHPAVPATFSPREKERRPRRACNSTVKRAKPRFPEAALRIYDKDLADHALSQIPAAIKFNTTGEFREYLTEKLRFDSQATRRRAAGYLIGRYFPGDALHRDLVEFAAKTAGKQALSDALFYLTCRMEPIVASVAEEVVFPSLPQGGVPEVESWSSCKPNSPARSPCRT